MTLAAVRHVLMVAVALTAGLGRQGTDDPTLRAAVERFFTTQQTEDVQGYLSLWSRSAQAPRPEQLKYVFDAGDDTYSEIVIGRTLPQKDGGVRVRVSATRERVVPSRIPDRPPVTMRTTTAWSLLYVKEGEEWKLVREGPAADGLAEALLDEPDAAAREQLLLAESDLLRDELIHALSRRAGQSAQMQMYAAAQTGFERAREVAQRVGNRRLEGEALQNLASARYYLKDFAGALQAYQDRLAIERERDDRDGISAALLGVGTIQYTLAEYASALSTYRDALAIQEVIGDEGMIATTLINMGNVLYLQGEFTAAIEAYSRSRDISRRTTNTAGEADALEGLGRVLMAQGDYAAALDAFTGVLAEGRARNDRREQGSALLSIGDVHFRLGNLEEARAALVDSRGHFEGTSDGAGAGRAWQATALVDLVASRFTLAEDGYRKSAAACGTAGDAGCAASATAGLAFAQTAQEKFADGIANYRKAVTAFATLKATEQAARAEVGLSRALARSGAHAAALEAAGRSRQQAEALKNDDVLWRALVAEAEALRRLRDRPKALASATAAVAAVDRLLEVAKVRPAAPVARDSSAAFATLALLQAEDGDAAAAFESAERMRTHDLRVLLAPGEREISRGMTDRERDDERALAMTLVSLHAQLARERGLPKPDVARIGRLEAAIAEAAQARAVQQQSLFARLPGLQTWRGLMTAATRADVESLLTDSDTVLIELVVGEDALLVLIARRGENGVRFSAQFEPASRGVIATRVAKLLPPETQKDPAAWKTAGLELVPGLAAAFGSAKHAIVVPHEVLWRVPFEALPTESGYLADTTSIVYAPSVTALVRSPSSPALEKPAERLVAVAAPVLAPALVDEIRRTAPGWTLRSAEAAQQEVAAIGGDAAAALTGEAATKPAVIEKLTQADIIHVAAPFRVNGASPLFSPLLLGAGAAVDGTVEAREIMNLDLHATVAVLSDGAAMSMTDAADEVGAIAWAWRAAGVPNLVLPRWAVDDAAATAFVRAVHGRLRAGDAPERALQAARETVRATAATSAPFYWSGWMLIGRR
jgi:CHAT domain-containing protein/tetratricopeptide (TPR) repeat protein